MGVVCSLKTLKLNLPRWLARVFDYRINKMAEARMVEFRKPLLSLDDRKLKGKIDSIDVDIDRQEVQVRIQHIACLN